LKKKIAKALALLLILSSAVVFSPATLQVDVVSAATGATPAPATSAPAAPAASGGQVYVVADGDMMWKIAQKHNLTLEQLLKLNPQITAPNRIYVGQKIVISANPSAPAISTEAGKLKIYQGLGHTVAFRNGPGKDDTGVPVYSFNIVMADATFDAEGRILNCYIDGYEVATPNYDGASMPHFSGWPGKEGYNITDHETAKVTGVSQNTPESIAAEVNAWKTKRERGDTYHMNPANEWYKQMDFYQNFFVGKTLPELREWFTKNTTAAGRPIKATTTKQDELDKLAKLTDAEKAALADVVAGATMSISDAHGDFLGALENAYTNRVEVVIPVK